MLARPLNNILSFFRCALRVCAAPSELTWLPQSSSVEMADTFVDTRRDLEEVIEEAFDQLATNTYILL